jgi:hypothetical protein
VDLLLHASPFQREHSASRQHLPSQQQQRVSFLLQQLYPSRSGQKKHVSLSDDSIFLVQATKRYNVKEGENKPGLS